MEYVITSTWDGKRIPHRHWVAIDLALNENGLTMNVDSPFYNDPAPSGAVGPTDGLWEFEAVELFLLGNGNRYLEVELSPHGHHLVLILKGKRNIIDTKLPLAYNSRILGPRWRGTAEIPAHYIPEEAHSGNIYAIYGHAEKRTYLALYPLGGDAPDFHRLEDFGPLLTDHL